MVKKQIAVMQPYIFPYLGYFQLVNAADLFVFYDDVNFIKQGWINRNKILANKRENLFTIPVKKLSSNRLINETQIVKQQYPVWKKKFLKGICQSYSKAPYFSNTYNLIEKVLNKEFLAVSDLAIESIKQVSSYLELSTEFSISSIAFNHTHNMDKAERLVQITRESNSNHYINLIGGKDLYEKKYFEDKGIILNFLEPNLSHYDQLIENFVPGLSIIDILMFNNKDKILQMLSDYKLK